jgi:hypothetical protein
MIISLLSAKIVDQYVLRRKTQIGQNRVRASSMLFEEPAYER